MSNYKDSKLAAIGYYMHQIDAEMCKDFQDEKLIITLIKQIKSASREQYTEYLNKRKENGF